MQQLTVCFCCASERGEGELLQSHYLRRSPQADGGTAPVYYASRIVIVRGTLQRSIFLMNSQEATKLTAFNYCSSHIHLKIELEGHLNVSNTHGSTEFLEFPQPLQSRFETDPWCKPRACVGG